MEIENIEKLKYDSNFGTIFKYQSSISKLITNGFNSFYSNSRNKCFPLKLFQFERMVFIKKSITLPNYINKIEFIEDMYDEKIKKKKKITYIEKNFFQNGFINYILAKRKKNAVKISSFLKRKLLIIKTKKCILIQKVISKRRILIVKLQSNITAFLVRKIIKDILNSKYVFFYRVCPTLISKLNISDNFYENENKFLKISKDNIQNIKCQIYKSLKNMETIKFIYCRLLNIYYLPLKKFRIIKKQYKVNFIVNAQKIIDSRYYVDIDNKGNYYNIISKYMIYRFKKDNIECQNNGNKFWKKFFKNKQKKRTNILDSQSISNSNETNIEPYDIIKNDLKPILKNSTKKNEFFLKNKKNIKNKNVSFNYKILYCN